jgi:hypothetical protein
VSFSAVLYAVFSMSIPCCWTILISWLRIKVGR